MNLDDSCDITVVAKMVKDYKQFLRTPVSSTGHNQSIFKSPDERLQETDMLSLKTRKRSTVDDYFTLTKDEKADILATKSKVAKLETDLNTSDVENQKRRLEERTKYKALSAQLQSTQEKCDAMERRFKQVMSQKDAAIAELEELRKNFKESESLNKNELIRLTQERNQLSMKFDEARTSVSDELLELREKCRRQTNDLQYYNSKLTEAELLMRNFKKRYDESNAMCQDYNTVKTRCEVAEAKIKTLEEKLSSIDETSLLMQHSQTELSNYRALENENKALKEENQLLRDGEENMLVLNEKLLNQSNKLKKADATIELLKHVEVKNEYLKKKLTGINERPKSEVELKRIISELENTTIVSSERIGELNMSLSIMDASLTNQVKETAALAETTDMLKAKHDALDDKYCKLQRRLILIKTERDGLRQVLASYEAEDGKASRIEVEEANNCTKVAREQIESLESQITELKKELSEKVQQEGKRVLPKSKNTTLEDESINVVKDSVQLEECKKQLAKLQKEFELIQTERDDLNLIMEKRKLQGEYNPTKTRLVHLKNNPAQQAFEQYTRETKEIREENERLRKKVLQLQSQAEASENENTMDVSRLIKGSKQMIELSKALEKEKLQKKRMNMEFSKEVKEFRAAVQQIFGYSFKAAKEGVYKAQSIYSTSPDDFFMFTCTKNKDGNILPGMIDTEFTRQWMQLFKDYVQRGDSIPAFLASVTLDLFSQSTEIRDCTIAKKAKQV